MGIEQHLVTLRRIGLNHEDAAKVQLQVCRLSLAPDTAYEQRSSLQSNGYASPGSKRNGT
jgi:hypothetical protein